ncbi:MAG: CRTAC1 family protein [Pirellula sp.]|jgi:hypothetical protein
MPSPIDSSYPIGRSRYSYELVGPRCNGIVFVIAICILLPTFAGCTDSSSDTTDPITKKEIAQRNSAATPPTQEKQPSAIAGSSSDAATNKSALKFTSHGSDVGIDFTYHNGEGAWLVAMIESNGGGIGSIDYDRDGRWDLFIPGGGTLSPEKEIMMVSNGLFQQHASPQSASAQQGPVKKIPLGFREVSGKAACDAGVCYSFGAAVSDYDSDGLPDIFITGFGGQQLLRNQGDGTFEDVTQSAGFHHRGWSSSAAWFDLENDGDLDLYIAHYGVWSPALDKRCFNAQGEIDRCAPADFSGEPDELWVNQGDGTFRDASEFLKAFPFRGVGVVACDFDLDGDTDLYVANDEDPNVLLDNQGNGELKEIGASSGTSLGSRSIVDGSMGLAVADFDGNLKPDILVTNYQNEYCELYLNQGKQYFSLGTRSAGLMALGQAVVGWGTAFFDADHDSDDDLVVIAGHTSRRPIRSSNLQKPYLLENVQGKRLVSIGDATGEFFRQVHAGRGMAIGDYDNDGDIDFAVSMLEQPVELLTNDTPNLGNFLELDLVGTQSNRDAVGAWVELELGTIGSVPEKRVKHRIGGGSYASTHATTIHFGIGNSIKIPRATIHWPSGQTQTLTDLTANQRLIVTEPSASDSINP